MIIPSKTVKRRIMKSPAARAEYERLRLEFELAATLIRARKQANLSQLALAKKMGTNQPTIAKLESGKRMPTTRTLTRFAEATGCKLKIELVRA